eukprot:7188782-Prymnesium_polylepis.1
MLGKRALRCWCEVITRNAMPFPMTTLLLPSRGSCSPPALTWQLQPSCPHVAAAALLPSRGSCSRLAFSPCRTNPPGTALALTLIWQVSKAMLDRKTAAEKGDGAEADFHAKRGAPQPPQTLSTATMAVTETVPATFLREASAEVLLLWWLLGSQRP